MTDKIKAIVERSPTDIVRYPIVKSIVNRDGSRAIDTAQITMPIGVRVAVNDTVSYIQDDVSLEHLVALWNFQGSTRDESGFHHDGQTQGVYINPEGTGNSKAYRTNYGLNFTTVSGGVTVVDKDMSSHKTDASIDFRQQFDIIINFKSMDNGGGSPTNTTQILFSKHNGTNGVEIGIKQVSGKWVIYAKLDSTTFTGDGTLFAADVGIGKIDHGDSGVTRCIRFYRDHESKVRLTLDGIADGTDSGECVQTVEPATNSRVTTDLKIGSDRLGSDDFKGFIFQIRVYCGGYLTDDDFQTLQSAGAQQMTQKISGNVWKRKDTLKNITVDVKSRSRTILDSEITVDIINDNTTNTDKPATHTKNLFEGGQDITDIMQTIIKYVDPDFVYLKSPAISSPIELAADGQFLSIGRFIRNVELLTIMANRSFLTFPTKTFVWEENTDGASTKLNTGYTFEDTEYQIYSRGEDDTKIINDLELYGDLNYGFDELNFGLLSSFTDDVAHSTTFVRPPLNVTIRQGAANYADGGANGRHVPLLKYNVDFNKKTLTFNDTSDSSWSWRIGTGVESYVWAQYNYEITDDVTVGQGGTDLNKRHDRRNNSTSVGIYGRRSAKIYIPQLLRKSDFSTIAQKILLRSKDSKRRYTIKAPFMINCLRENLQITLKSSVMKFTNTNDGTESLTEILEPVKSIEWRYPECTTVIEVGDHFYDLYGTAKETDDIAGSTQGSLLKTQSNA